MYKIVNHPILEIPESKPIEIEYNGKTITAHKGYTIAAALHQAGFPIHSHSIDHRERSLECGIGKCGACEMLVDGKIKRICITKVDDVKRIEEIPDKYLPDTAVPDIQRETKVYYTSVAIIGAGPAGLACREELNKWNIPNIVIDNNDTIGGQFNMQTHQFFFFEKEKKFGGMRGFEIAKTLAGEDKSGIFLNCTVWDILEAKRLGVKNMNTGEIFYIVSETLVVGTGAVPFMPAFENDDLPGVYTAAVVQKMMNTEHTLLGNRILSIGAGNIAYLTSYQAMQAGATVVAIIEGMPKEGGFPVQANRVRRLGIPIMTSHVLLKAIPNENHDGIKGAVIAEAKDFQAIPGTEKLINNIDVINICTGLIPDDVLLTKGKTIFGFNCYGVGDANRVGEGTCAVLHGRQAAMEIAMKFGKRVDNEEYLSLSRDYINSQQHPVKVLEKPNMPAQERMNAKPFVVADCLYGFACNPCTFACRCAAISKSSTSTVPVIDYDKCVGCMDCISKCPGLAIFGYHLAQNCVFLPFEYEIKENVSVFLVDDKGEKLGKGNIEKIFRKSNKTHVARVKIFDVSKEAMTKITGFIPEERYPSPLNVSLLLKKEEDPIYVCHCDDVKIEQILAVVGERDMISVDELKHTTRLGMGPCRGKRCIPRIKQLLRAKGIMVIGDSTPRSPLSSQLSMSEVYPSKKQKKIFSNVHQKVSKRIDCEVFIAGGGITGSALLRYFAESGKKTVMCNADRGSSWRNIAGGRPAFSVPEIADIATHNLKIFKEIQSKYDVNFRYIRYVGFAHDETTYRALDASRAWSDAYMVEAKDFRKEISPYFNPCQSTYQAALITKNCWQATPGMVIDVVRNIGIQGGGMILEDCKLLEVQKTDKGFMALVQMHNKEYVEYHCEHFANALGANAAHFAAQLGIQTGLFPVKHQAFITRRLPLLGKNSDALDMLIDRRIYKGFSAVYGQQLQETGQIIGCASPRYDGQQANAELKTNDEDFMTICAEIFSDWIPQLSAVGFQALWSGYYTEPRYIVDPDKGLLIGMRGHGFMLGQYLAKIYVDKYLGKETPSYLSRLAMEGDGLSETAFK